MATKEKKTEQEADSFADNIEEKQYDKYLQCLLSEEEKRDAANTLVQRMEELARKEAELDSIKNQFKGELSRLEADIEVHKNMVRDGYVFRNVLVKETKAFDINMVSVVRLDTYQTIETRKLRADEMQKLLPGMA